MLQDADAEILAFYAFAPGHPSKLRSTNPLERLTKQVGRRTDVVGIFPDDRSLIRRSRPRSPRCSASSPPARAGTERSRRRTG
jgi:transposase-like protein